MPDPTGPDPRTPEVRQGHLFAAMDLLQAAVSLDRDGRTVDAERHVRTACNHLDHYMASSPGPGGYGA